MEPHIMVSLRIPETQMQRVEIIRGEYESRSHAVMRAMLAGIDALISRKITAEHSEDAQ